MSKLFNKLIWFLAGVLATFALQLFTPEIMTFLIQQKNSLNIDGKSYFDRADTHLALAIEAYEKFDNETARIETQLAINLFELAHAHKYNGAAFKLAIINTGVDEIYPKNIAKCTKWMSISIATKNPNASHSLCK